MKLVEPAPIKKIDHPWGDPPAAEKAPRYTPRQLAHPATLDERVAALEFDTRVIAQIVIGAHDGR